MKILEAIKRDAATSLDVLRNDGYVPAIAYKNGMENVILAVKENEVKSIWRDVKDTEAFTLNIEGTKHIAIMKDMQVHVVSGQILHIDFLVQ
jgi:large subunit ribosomal protein L25